MSIDHGQLGTAWQQACDHAEIRTPAEARLYLVPGPAAEERAIHIHPGTTVVRDHQFPFDSGQLADANSPDHVDLHRIAVRDISTEVLALALLRHELEHARQYRESLSVYRFMAVAYETLLIAFNDASLPTLEGSSLLYNALPHEVDANRAASSCVRAVLGETTPEAIEASYRHLVTQRGEPDLESLGARLTAWCALFPAEAERASAGQGGLRVAIGAMDTGLATWWFDVRPGTDLADRGVAGLDAAPSVVSVAAADQPGAAWEGVRGVLVAGETAGVRSITMAG